MMIRSIRRACGLAGVVAATAGILGCLSEPGRPAAAPPEGAPGLQGSGPREPGVRAVSDLTQPGAVARATANPTIIDTRTRPAGTELLKPTLGPVMRPKFLLPDHELPAGVLDPRPNPPAGPDDRPVPELTPQIAEPTTAVQGLFPGITQTGWVPPDPALAVGPAHVLMTVNSRLAWYTKDGTAQFAQDLQPFFSSVNAGGFCFDPKCFYDHLSRRFVVLALETYGTTEAWITIAVSDDEDPNGVWYRYRTDAVINVGGQTFWWDYPGLGYDAQGIYVSGNLFGLSAGGWAGVGFRVFDKAALYAGQPAVYSTLRDGGGASVQAAQCFGPSTAPYFVSLGSGLKLQAITNPLTSPAIVTRDIAIPGWAGPGAPPAAGGQSVSAVDGRIFNVCFRDGMVYATHHVTAGGKTVARWYQVRTNTWPAANAPQLVGSGNIDPGGTKHSFFPAIYANRFGDLGMVMGTSSPTDRIAVAVAGRPAGQGAFGAPTQAAISGVDAGGRWGDYYDIAADPADDTLFWFVGEYGESFGWTNWLGSFRVGTLAGPTANPDQMGSCPIGEETAVDVLANDAHFQGLPLTITAFDAASARGGAVRRLAGAGPGGRDMLGYTPAAGTSGPDSFLYTVSDTAGRSSRAAATGTVLDTSTFRDPENPDRVVAGLDAAYYVLVSPTQIPDFTGRTPYLTAAVPQLNYPSTGGEFANSTRTNNVGALFTGYIDVPTTDVYTFYTESDEGSRLKIGTTTVVENDGNHTMRERSGTIGLKRGVHAIRVEYFERSLAAGLIASWQSGSAGRAVIPAGVLLRPNTCGADFNGDGFVDFFDYDDFVGAFESGDPAADFNEDGFLDFFDYDDFVTAYAAGC